MINWKYALFLPLVFMIGCVEKVNERYGPEIEIFPVTFSISLSKSDNSDEKLSAFFADHSKDILNYGLEIRWFNTAGKKWANDIRKDLLIRGVNRDLITVSHNEKRVSHFDLKLTLIKPKVEVSSCEYAKIGGIGNQASGCFVENARWASMVNPQKMLLDTKKSVAEGNE